MEKLTKVFTVEANHTAKALGSGELEVLATPMLVAYMEATAQALIADRFKEGEGTVGGAINIKHLAPTGVGQEVKVEAQLVKVQNDRLFNFAIEAYEGRTLIAQGRHQRAKINNKKFLAKLKNEE